MTNNLIIGAIDLYQEWKQVAPWAISAREQHDGDIVMLTYRTTPEIIANLQKLAIDVYSIEFDEFGKKIIHNHSTNNTKSHHLRFFHIYQFLLQNDTWKLYNNVLITDVRDVYFQNNPFIYLNKHKISNIIVTSENIRYRDEQWGRQNLIDGFGNLIYEFMKDSTIYNVGAWGGRSDLVMGMSSLLFSMTQNRFYPSDQSSWNFLINNLGTDIFTKLDLSVGYACHCGTTLDSSKNYQHVMINKIPKIVDGKVLTENDVEFSIIHQYDRIPELNKYILKINGLL